VGVGRAPCSWQRLLTILPVTAPSLCPLTRGHPSAGFPAAQRRSPARRCGMEWSLQGGQGRGGPDMHTRMLTEEPATAARKPAEHRWWQERRVEGGSSGSSSSREPSSAHPAARAAAGAPAGSVRGSWRLLSARNHPQSCGVGAEGGRWVKGVWWIGAAGWVEGASG
jgi:hypothetical protein